MEYAPRERRAEAQAFGLVPTALLAALTALKISAHVSRRRLFSLVRAFTRTEHHNAFRMANPLSIDDLFTVGVSFDLLGGYLLGRGCCLRRTWISI